MNRRPNNPAPSPPQRYDVEFDADLEAGIARGDYEILESIRRPDPMVQPPRCTTPTRAHHDGNRLVLPLAAADTADDTYSAIEVSTTPCTDQDVLDRMLAEGSMKCLVPGREATFRDFLCSPHFDDGSAAAETVNVGVVAQSWRGHLDGRNRLVALALTYIGGTGIAPAMFSRSLHRRSFVATVVDFTVGLTWARALPDFRSGEPHDITLRWFPDRNVEFLVDGRRVADYEDGRSRVSPLKLRKTYRRGFDLVGHRYITAEALSLTAFADCVSVTPDFHVGRRLSRDLWVAIGGFGIEPLD